MEKNFVLADVFTERPFGGNPLAVFLDAEGLDSAQMQTIAAELNLSETAFLGRPESEGAAWPLRIFTPKMELPFAGHPTIGTALGMAWAGLLKEGDDLVFQEGVGPVSVTLSWQDRRAVQARLTITAEPDLREPQALERLGNLIGLEAGDLGTCIDGRQLSPKAVSMGVPFTILPVKDLTTLSQAEVNLGTWRDLLAESWAPHLYLIAPASAEESADFRVRMFAPAMGIAEDPATGAAAAALAALLTDAGLDGPWHLDQGVEMGRPSRLSLSVKERDGRNLSLEVGGAAVKTGSGQLLIPAQHQC